MDARPEALALSGVEVEAVSDPSAVPDPGRFGRGVVLLRIHPDAPAAEAGLRPGDIIVRAMRENVDGPQDLTRVVGDREQTVLIAVRDGEYMELVLHRPSRADLD